MLFPWICIPVVCTALLFKWPHLISLSTLVMIVFRLSPYSFSIGIFYDPAIAVLLIATAVDLARRAFLWFKSRSVHPEASHRL